MRRGAGEVLGGADERHGLAPGAGAAERDEAAVPIPVAAEGLKLARPGAGIADPDSQILTPA